MDQRPHRFVIVIGAATWIVVTLAALSVIVPAPTEHVGLAIGLALIWVILIAFAAFSRVTERL